MVVGRLLSYWEGNFSGAMLNFGRVFDKPLYESHSGAKRISFCCRCSRVKRLRAEKQIWVWIDLIVIEPQNSRSMVSLSRKTAYCTSQSILRHTYNPDKLWCAMFSQLQLNSRKQYLWQHPQSCRFFRLTCLLGRYLVHGWQWWSGWPLSIKSG